MLTIFALFISNNKSANSPAGHELMHYLHLNLITIH